MKGKHAKLLQASFNAVLDKAEQGERWAKDHVVAMSGAIVRSPFESAIISVLEGAVRYADAHAKDYESGVGEDYVLGPEWRAIVSGLRGLLNGETGRLDCGTIDSLLVKMLKTEGFDNE